MNTTTRRVRRLGDTGSSLYRVVSGDTLSLITWRYGRPGQDVVALWFANAQAIGPDPNALKAGQTLALPDGWSTGPGARTGRPDQKWVNEAYTALVAAKPGYMSKPKPAPVDPPAPLVPPAEIRKQDPPLVPPPGPGPSPSGGLQKFLAALAANRKRVLIAGGVLIVLGGGWYIYQGRRGGI